MVQAAAAVSNMAFMPSKLVDIETSLNWEQPLKGCLGLGLRVGMVFPIAGAPPMAKTTAILKQKHKGTVKFWRPPNALNPTNSIFYLQIRAPMP